MKTVYMNNIEPHWKVKRIPIWPICKKDYLWFWCLGTETSFFSFTETAAFIIQYKRIWRSISITHCFFLLILGSDSCKAHFHSHCSLLLDGTFILGSTLAANILLQLFIYLCPWLHIFRVLNLFLDSFKAIKIILQSSFMTFCNMTYCKPM
jgi:hypothetical protein